MNDQRVNIAQSFIDWCRANECLHVDDPGFLPSLELTIANAIRHSLEVVIASAVREILRQAATHNEPLQIDMLMVSLSEIVAKELGELSEAHVDDLGEEL